MIQIFPFDLRFLEVKCDRFLYYLKIGCVNPIMKKKYNVTYKKISLHDLSKINIVERTKNTSLCEQCIAKKYCYNDVLPRPFTKNYLYDPGLFPKLKFVEFWRGHVIYENFVNGGGAFCGNKSMNSDMIFNQFKNEKELSKWIFQQ